MQVLGEFNDKVLMSFQMGLVDSWSVTFVNLSIQFYEILQLGVSHL